MDQHIPDEEGDQNSEKESLLIKLAEFNRIHGKAANLSISTDVDSVLLQVMDSVVAKSWASFTENLRLKPLKRILKKSAGFPLRDIVDESNLLEYSGYG